MRWIPAARGPAPTAWGSWPTGVLLIEVTDSEHRNTGRMATAVRDAWLHGARTPLRKSYDPSEPRDEQGRWTGAGDAPPPLGKFESDKLPDDAKQAIANTPGAKLTERGLELDMSRYQDAEQAGEPSVRTGVFYLPESKSPWGHFYTGPRAEQGGYGGAQRVDQKRVLENPMVVKASTGGRGPELAYNKVVGKGAYQKMRDDVLSGVTMWGPGGKRPPGFFEDKIKALFAKHGGNPAMASDIVANSTKGNLLAYALQEHIVAHALRKAGYDAVVSYSKHKGAPRLAEVFDLHQTHYPTGD